ncbi:MAG TPA: hypothetical protein VFG43_05740 [Geminicoccaceae bacterium]|nr:hypothetical protein [Geminicoccaceae bacterium]
MNGTTVIVAVLLAMLAGSSAVGFWIWRELGAVEIGLHGTIALVLGVTVTFALGVGLMSLVYYSHKHGFDDDAGRGDP